MNNTPNTPLSHTATNPSFSRSNLFPSKSDFPSQAQFFPALLLSQWNINILSYFFFHKMNRYQTLIKKRITFSRHKALFSTHPPPTSNLISANDEPLGFVPAEVIKKKRDGKVLTESEIHWMISEFHNKSGTILDYQMASFLMTICVKGMNEREAMDLTNAMMYTGSRNKLRDKLVGVSNKIIDKHSTGGVGDKVSLVVAPLAASLGLVVPMVSSRGLGHTGGTIDKIESIPGYRSDLTPEEFYHQLATIGCGIISTNHSVSPVENRIYALRDTSGSVDSPALIASSIMSKKLANIPDALLLDVKTGRGAFMSHLKDAVALARMMVSIGENSGVRTRALITNMDQPLGSAVGNFLEVREAVDVLDPKALLRSYPPSPALQEVQDLALCLVASMQCMAGNCDSYSEAHSNAQAKLADGSAFDIFLQMIEFQGGDPRAVLNANEHLKKSTHSTLLVTAPKEGRIRAIDSLKIGMASLALGSGRLHAGDPIDPYAGIILHVKVGDLVKPGDPLFTCYVGNVDLLGMSPSIRLERGSKRAEHAFNITDPNKHCAPDPLVSYLVDTTDIYTFDPQKIDIKYFK